MPDQTAHFLAGLGGQRLRLRDGRYNTHLVEIQGRHADCAAARFHHFCSDLLVRGDIHLYGGILLKSGIHAEFERYLVASRQ